MLTPIYDIIETKQSIEEKTVVDGEELLRHIVIRIDLSKKTGVQNSVFEVETKVRSH